MILFVLQTYFRASNCACIAKLQKTEYRCNTNLCHQWTTCRKYHFWILLLIFTINPISFCLDKIASKLKYKDMVQISSGNLVSRWIITYQWKDYSYVLSIKALRLFKLPTSLCVLVFMVTWFCQGSFIFFVNDRCPFE